ncbi:uncharacterized protein LOC121054478 [Oryza brachyantha]|uniref:uncharacterized protein LOC121054478 n=1 Tax=Oryza brachyantha TaxID=4533 RepID=UPI001ADCA07F|nr:uncharacterized protein LOC121054478 [Oryza brachyantha]
MPPARKRKAPAPATPPRRPPPRLEFRSPVDGAWYDARVAVQGRALRVMYEEFTEEQDEWYDPAIHLSSPRDVAALRARFRARSPPLDDARCRDLRPGDPLCVACALAGDELKYYDAVLESVSPAAHESVDGEERCACRFSVRWAGGPLAGGREEVGVEKVCCVRSTPVRDPVLAEFLDGVTKSLGDGEDRAAAAASSQSSGAVSLSP